MNTFSSIHTDHMAMLKELGSVICGSCLAILTFFLSYSTGDLLAMKLMVTAVTIGYALHMANCLELLEKITNKWACLFFVIVPWAGSIIIGAIALFRALF